MADEKDRMLESVRSNYNAYAGRVEAMLIGIDSALARANADANAEDEVLSPYALNANEQKAYADITVEEKAAYDAKYNRPLTADEQKSYDELTPEQKVAFNAKRADEQKVLDAKRVDALQPYVAPRNVRGGTSRREAARIIATLQADIAKAKERLDPPARNGTV